MIRHLTSEEISKALIGDLSPERQLHARECPECGAEWARLKETFLVFSESAHAWPEKIGRSTVPAEIDFQTRPSRVRIRPLRWALAGVAVITLLAIPLYRNASEQKRAAQAAEDALLLEQVNASLSRDVPAPMEPLMKLISDSSVEGAGRRQ